MKKSRAGKNPFLYCLFFEKKRSSPTDYSTGVYLSGTFSIEVLMHPQRKLMEKQVQWRDLWASMWLMTTIGGLGSRARRGLGTIRWMNSEESPLPSMCSAKTPEEWVDQFRQGVRQLWEWYLPRPLSKNSYPMVKPSMKIFVCKEEYSN